MATTANGRLRLAGPLERLRHAELTLVRRIEDITAILRQTAGANVELALAKLDEAALECRGRVEQASRDANQCVEETVEALCDTAGELSDDLGEALGVGEPVPSNGRHVASDPDHAEYEAWVDGQEQATLPAVAPLTADEIAELHRQRAELAAERRGGSITAAADGIVDAAQYAADYANGIVRGGEAIVCHLGGPDEAPEQATDTDAPNITDTDRLAADTAKGMDKFLPPLPPISDPATPEAQALGGRRKQARKRR